MIARIQNLYLLLVGLLAVASMFFPFWSFNARQIYLISDFSVPEITTAGYALLCYAERLFSPLTAIVAVTAIFLFKNRAIQSKLITLALLFFVGDLFAGLTAAHFMNLHFEAIGAALTHKPEAGFFILLPEPVLLMLALKGVKKDEKIANAYKRL
ncbi:MAG: DUF4293 domain-containing protein [Chlorobium sp.]